MSDVYDQGVDVPVEDVVVEQVASQPQIPAYTQAPIYPQAQTAAAPVSIGTWIGLYCLSFLNVIPCLGTVAYFAALGYIALKNPNETLRNWAKAMLIIMAAAAVLGLLIGLLFGGTIATIMSNMDPALLETY